MLRALRVVTVAALAGCAAAGRQVATPDRAQLAACAAPVSLTEADPDFILGQASAPTEPAAFDRARADAVSRLTTHVTARTTQSRRESDTAATMDASSQVESLALRTISACDTLRRCERDGQIEVTVRCDRRSELDREVALQMPKLAAALPKDAVVLIVPGFDEDGNITALGEHLAQVFLARLDTPGHGNARFAQPAHWQPAALHDVARQQKASHLLRIKHRRSSADLLDVDAVLLDAATDQMVPGSNVMLHAHLQLDELGQLAVRGALLPQKDAMELAAGDKRGVELEVTPAVVAEGDTVSVRFRLHDDAYVLLLDLYEDGQVAAMTPGPLAPQQKFIHGIWYFGEQKLLACALPGHAVTRENLKLIAAPVPFWAPIVPFVEEGVVLKPGPHGKIAELVLATEKWRGSGQAIAEATAAYVVHSTGSEKCRSVGQ